jgi:hypothetical protein
MKRETAEKIAAAESGMRLEHTQTAIKSFLKNLVKCPACDGTGRIIYTQPVRVPVEGLGTSEATPQVEVGREADCPLCGPGGQGDPEWVVWRLRDSHYTCHARDAERPNGHEDCGWIVTLPWERE